MSTSGTPEGLTTIAQDALQEAQGATTTLNPMAMVIADLGGLHAD